MMESVLDVASWILLVGGTAFALIGGVGLLRLPDLYTRMHGAGITDTLGAGMILTGLMVQSGFSLASAKLGFIVFFLLLTSPTSTHALARSARSHGIQPALPDDRGRPSST